MEALLRRLVSLKSDPRVRKIAGHVAYVLFVFAFVEVSLQIFYYMMAGDFLFRRDAPPLYQSEPYAGYGNRRDLSYVQHTNEFTAHYDINHEGFRVPEPNLEYTPEKPAGTYRILLLGPSFAYGWGVDYKDSFAAQLPRILKQRGFAGGRKIELINAGVPSLQPAPQLNWYNHVGKKYHPDLVIQFIYASMAEPSDPPSHYAADAKGYLIDKNMTAGQRWRERAKQFATVFYGWTVWTDFDAWLHAESGSQNGAVRGAGRNLIQESGFSVEKPAVRKATAFYRRLARTVEKSGAQLQIVYFPLSYAIYPADKSRWRHLGVRNVAAQKAFDSAFVDYLNKQNIPAVDITDDLLKASEQEKRLYYWLDIHWTPAGNAAAARAVADALSSPR